MKFAEAASKVKINVKASEPISIVKKIAGIEAEIAKQEKEMAGLNEAQRAVKANLDKRQHEIDC